MSPGDLHPESRFDADWLALRESADADARSRELTERAARWLGARGHRPLQCMDLGSGSGSNPRFLAPRLPGPQSWRLLDHDATLLARAQQRCRTLRDVDGNPVAVQVECRDLSGLAADTFLGVDLLSASALIDLVSADWLDGLAEASARAGVAVLFSLSVDGLWAFHRNAREDSDPDDAFACAAFNAHQRRDKGVGGALGPDAHAVLAARLRAAGYRVWVGPSPWRLRTDRAQETALAEALVDGWLAAALEQEPAAAGRLRDWHARRRAALGTPDFTLTVGHVDLFACPPGDAPGEETHR